MRDTRSRSSSRLNYYTTSSNINTTNNTNHHQQHYPSTGLTRDRSVPRGMYSVLSSLRSGSSQRARSPSMMNEEAIHLAQYPSGQKPSPDAVAKIERDDFPAPPFPYPDRASGARSQPETESPMRSEQKRASRPRSREIVITDELDDSSSNCDDPRFKKEEEELSKIASGIGKVFLQTLKEREKLRAWKRANLDPRNSSRTPSATRELPSRLRYDNPTNASPSRDINRPRPWDEEDGPAGSDVSPTRGRSPVGRPSQMSASSAASYGYKVVQSNRSTPKPGYGLSAQQPNSSYGLDSATLGYNNGTMGRASEMSFSQQQRATQNQSAELLHRAAANQQQAQYPTQPPPPTSSSSLSHQHQHHHYPNQNQHHHTLSSTISSTGNTTANNNHNHNHHHLHHQSELGADNAGTIKSTASRQSAHSFNALHLRRSMPNLNSLHHLHREGPPKLYPYHLLATSNYRLPPDVDRCHLERHLSNEEFHFIFHCDRIDFYRLPEWKRNELKRRAKLF